MYDVIIVGGGPAGLTAGIYTTRRTLKTLLISKDFGGILTEVTNIENYPGFKSIDGMDLMKIMEEQAKKSGVNVIYGKGIKKIIQDDEHFSIFTDNDEEYRSKAVIIAIGNSTRHLEIPGEKKFQNKGISYCVNCDGPLFRDEEVCVIGGGDAALDAALVMSDIGKKVYLIHRRDQFTAFESIIEKVKSKSNIEIIYNTIIREFKGEEMLNSILVENIKTGDKKELKVAGAFIEIGSVVKTDFLRDFINLDENNLIIVNEKSQTFYPNSEKVRHGVYAAGTVTNIQYKQIVVATFQGAIAAFEAYNFIKGLGNNLHVDWGHKK